MLLIMTLSRWLLKTSLRVITLENKMQRTLRKIKQHLDENEYKRTYPTGSRPGFFYTTAKVHKLQNGEGLNELTT